MPLPALCLGLDPPVFLLRSLGEPCWHIHAAHRHGHGMLSQGSIPGRGKSELGTLCEARAQAAWTAPQVAFWSLNISSCERTRCTPRSQQH